MTHIAPLLSLLLTSSLLRWGAAEASILCTWTRVLPNEQVHYTFLRRDPLQASQSMRLYNSAWSGRVLLSCAWSEHAAVVQNYFSLCQERTHEFVNDADPESFNVDVMFEGDDTCVSVDAPDAGGHAEKRSVRSVGGAAQPERSEVRSHQRVKRGFIVPGTLWCGSGNKAPSYADLGVFADTDSCCREHDQCQDTILSFHSRFGVFNSNIFTMSHCDCDNKFHRCLMEANDSISDVVGYTFFNLLKMHCFEFSHRLQCAERNWFGMCKETKMALYAEVHPPTLYESSNPNAVNINGSIINATLPRELLENSTLKPKLPSNTAAASTPPPLISSPSASITSINNNITASEPDRLQNSIPTNNGTLLSHLDVDIREKQMLCAVYKDLDECRDKILPQQKRYGLHNLETKTLYHCNCTSRLFQTLVKQRKLTEVQTLLLGHVSKSCFLMQDCTADHICTAVLVKAQLPLLDNKGSLDMEEQRHLQAVRLKVRRPNSRRAKRKDRAVRLHKLCLKMNRAKHNKISRL
ncbi:group 3 secretory phospholipase A2 [Notolabrus celidotus]|uniref:group 3 secretory phospholipase A2 n=1 Tax=Notolabrus celidotus TaxID=1203425 RepID=UPI0014901AC5|nr:group 3 secretory phospholipase A2 [Notolabrus celidotus]